MHLASAVAVHALDHLLRKDGIYDRQIAEANGVQPLLEMLQMDNHETRGFAAACLMCLCNDPGARVAIIEARGADPLQLLANGPNAWLRQQAEKMLQLLEIPLLSAEDIETLRPASPKEGSPGGVPVPAYMRSDNLGGVSNRSSAGYRSHRQLVSPQVSARSSISARTKFHFFSFQVNHLTGFLGHG